MPRPPFNGSENRKVHGRRIIMDLLGVSPLLCGFRTLVIAVVALLVWWPTRLPAPLVALSAIVVWADCNAFKDIKDYLTRQRRAY
jgi:hypothetical protein